MKKLLYLFISISVSSICCGQQHALHSQYIFNLYMINPAYAGARDALSASLSYRNQWVGFEGAPQTQTFTLHSPMRKKNMALGVLIQNDVIGARNTTYAAASYAYKLKLNRREYISLGLQAGILNYHYNWSLLEYERPNDPVAYTVDGGKLIPNFDFGVMYISPKSYIGFSATSLNGSKLNDNMVSDARMDMYFNLIAGKVFDMNEDIALKPSFLVRKSMEGTAQFDLNIGALINNSLWVTATYRYQFGLVFSAHCTIRNRLHVGYAYDYALNGLMSQQSGTHEIFLGYDFNIYRNRSSSPRYF